MKGEPGLSLSEDQIRLLRMRAQRLIAPGGRAHASMEQVVKEVCAVQAQDLLAALLSIGARGAGLTASEIDRARQVERTIVRTWCMRGTLHLVTAEDAAWLIPFLGPVFVAASQRRFQELGLNEESSARAMRVIRQAIAEQGALRREQIIQVLRENDLPSEGQAPFHLIYRAALEGLICYGPDQGKQPTFAPFEEWIGETLPMPREAALARLARRYLQAYGPAGPKDMASWSGLSLRDARQAWQLISDELAKVDIGGRTAWMLKTQVAWLDGLAEHTPVVRLLPRFDTYLLGYADREMVVLPPFAKRIHPGGGIIHPAVIVDGRALGTWKTKPRRAALEVIVEPFESFPARLIPELEQEVAGLGRFFGVDAVLDFVVK